MTPDPLVIEFDVGVPPARAFEAWTQQCATWWPTPHTISGDPAAITFEPRSGGRIFERGADGGEHEWGTILEWQPPTRLRYLWHLFFDPSEATEVEITFTPRGPDTAVRLEQRGSRGSARPARSGAIAPGAPGPRSPRASSRRSDRLGHFRTLAASQAVNVDSAPKSDGESTFTAGRDASVRLGPRHYDWRLRRARIASRSTRMPSRNATPMTRISGVCPVVTIQWTFT
jgi:uncharacterized protein YndB with AHSA1/START domain